MNKFYRTNRPVNLLPLMDVIFLVLAVFFYLMLFMVRHEGVEIDLPSALTTESNKQQFVSISLDSNNALFLDKEPIKWEHLEREIIRLKRNLNPDLVIYIAADKHSQHEYFVKILDELRKQDITNVNIETSDN